MTLASHVESPFGYDRQEALVKIGCCVRCKRPKPIKLRGLCNACVTAARKAGQLEQYPTVRPRVDVAALAQLDTGELDDQTLARLLGVSPGAVRTARYRHLHPSPEAAEARRCRGAAAFRAKHFAIERRHTG